MSHFKSYFDPQEYENPGFSVHRPPRTSYAGDRSVRWALEVIKLWRVNCAQRTRYPYPSEEIFCRSRGPASFDEGASATKRRAQARAEASLSKVRASGGMGKEARRSEVDGNAAPRKRSGPPAGPRPKAWRSVRYHPRFLRTRSLNPL